MELTHEIIDALSQKYGNGYTDYANDYGEPGYTLSEGKQGVLFDNWNGYPQHVLTRFERDYELEWYDEWYISSESCPCLAYRTSPDCYSWTPSILFCDGYVLTPEDAESDPESVVQEFINEPEKMNIFDLDYDSLGFELVKEDVRCGWYGREDDPYSILEELQEKYPQGEFIFTDYWSSQFEMGCNVYGRNLETKKEESK